jgi:Tfp pilus assembly protein PilV
VFTDRPLLGDERGTALIGAVVAMLILAVGMVGLITAGAGATRSLASAEWTTVATTLATRYLEDAQRELIDHSTVASRRPQSRCETVDGKRVSVAIDLSVPRLPRIQVEVRPLSGQPARWNVSLTSDLFFDVPLTGPVQGAPCD